MTSGAWSPARRTPVRAQHPQRHPHRRRRTPARARPRAARAQRRRAARPRGTGRPLLVDVIGEGLTAARIVEAARQAAPQHEFTVRYGGGLGAALPQLLAGRLDVAFGRPDGLAPPVPRGADPAAGPLRAARPAAARGRPTGRSRGGPDGAPARHRARCQQRQRGRARVGRPRHLALSAYGARPSPPHPHVIGPGETARHLQQHGLPILTMTECPPSPAPSCVRSSTRSPSIPGRWCTAPTLSIRP